MHLIVKIRITAFSLVLDVERFYFRFVENPIPPSEMVVSLSNPAFIAVFRMYSVNGAFVV